ncbi:MAG: DUF4160 domain-containing protein [Terriglobia bacterium]
MKVADLKTNSPLRMLFPGCAKKRGQRARKSRKWRYNAKVPARALRLVLEWANLHKQELIENWQLAKQGQPLKRIAPLE